MCFQTKNADYYSQYVTEDFSSYIVRKRNEHCHGNHIEMQALSEMYNRTIEVYQYSTGKTNGRNCTREISCNPDSKNLDFRIFFDNNWNFHFSIYPLQKFISKPICLARSPKPHPFTFLVVSPYSTTVTLHGMFKIVLGHSIIFQIVYVHQSTYSKVFMSEYQNFLETA